MYTRSGSGWDAVYLQSLADGAVDVVRDDSVSAFSCAQQVSDEILSGLFACTCRHSGCFSGKKKHLQALADGFFGVVQGDSVSASPRSQKSLGRMPRRKVPLCFELDCWCTAVGSCKHKPPVVSKRHLQAKALS